MLTGEIEDMCIENVNDHIEYFSSKTKLKQITLISI